MGTISVRKLCGLVYMRYPFFYQDISKLIIVESVVVIILRLCVLCNCTEV